MKTLNKAQKQTIPQQEQIINDSPRTFTEADWPIGSVAHQGDLILVRITSLPKSAKPRKNRQLAEGNTQGSRHIVEGCPVFDCNPEEVVKSIRSVCPKAQIDAKFIGPVFQTFDGRGELTHPEHGNHCYEGDMTIATVIQRNLDAEQREQKVQD
jgi:hypothetical protein